MASQQIGPDLAKELDRILAAAVDNEEKLTPWEQSFVDDVTKRLEQYGAALVMSPKQWEIIERLRSKLGLGD